MLKTFTEYNTSVNDIYYHHSITIADDNKPLTMKPESHASVELLLLISGNVEYSINGESYMITAGDLIVVNINEIHSLIVNPAVPYERMVLWFPPAFLPKLYDLDLMYPFKNANLYRHILPKNLVQNSAIPEIMGKLETQCADTTRFKDSRIITLILELAIEINRLIKFLLTDTQNLMYNPVSVNKLLHLCVDYINQNITKNITGADIAQHLHISESYLYRIFKSSMNITIHKYICNRKMQLADSLLKQGKSPQEVSDYLGYEYYSTFFMNYKKHFSRTPKKLTYADHL